MAKYKEVRKFLTEESKQQNLFAWKQQRVQGVPQFCTTEVWSRKDKGCLSEEKNGWGHRKILIAKPRH